MSFPWPPEKSLMYQDTWHLIYCWIDMVASSSWSKVFFSLQHNTHHGAHITIDNITIIHPTDGAQDSPAVSAGRPASGSCR